MVNRVSGVGERRDCLGFLRNSVYLSRHLTVAVNMLVSTTTPKEIWQDFIIIKPFSLKAVKR